MQITRRRLVTGLSAPLILGAQDKSGAKPPVLGQGDQKYEWIDNWGQLPSHIKWGKTHNKTGDSIGNSIQSPRQNLMGRHVGPLLRRFSGGNDDAIVTGEKSVKRRQ